MLRFVLAQKLTILGAANRVALVKLDLRQKFRKNISEALLFAWSCFWSHTMNNLVSPSPAWSKL